MIYLWHESQLEIFSKRAQTNCIQNELQLLHFSNLFIASGSRAVFTLIVKLVKYSSASDSHKGCVCTQPVFMLGSMFIRRVHSSSLKFIGRSVFPSFVVAWWMVDLERRLSVAAEPGGIRSTRDGTLTEDAELFSMCRCSVARQRKTQIFDESPQPVLH